MEKRYPNTIMATACIPWNEEFQFDEASFRRQVKQLTDAGIRCIYLFGTAGEGYAVSREQYQTIVKAFLDQMKGVPGARPMVGVISLSMSEVIERIETGIKLGASDFQISFPSWGAVAVNEGIGFLRDVCGKFPAASFMHYNNGPRSKTKLRFNDYKRICDEIPNLVAVKNPTSDIRELHELFQEELPLEFFILEFGYGYASLFANCGLLISLLNLNLDHAWKYFDAGKRRDIAAITGYHNDFYKIHNELFANIPPGMIDSAYDKSFVKSGIPEFPLRLLPPYTGPADNQYEAFVKAVKAKAPHWKIGETVNMKTGQTPYVKTGVK